jgi:hypothetical protein
MTIPEQGSRSPDEEDDCIQIVGISAQEETIAISLQTRKKLAELMDQIDETVIALRREVEHAKTRRGEDDNARSAQRPAR